MTAARLVWAGLVLLAHATTAEAQVRVILYGDDRLAGIREVDVLVEVLADDPSRCAVSRSALQTRAVDALRAAGMRATLSEKASSWHYTVTMTVQSGPAGEFCASAVTTELIAQVEGFPEADKFAAPGAWGSILIGPMMLVRENALVTVAAREHDASVQAAARTQLSALADRIRRNNP